ncbi:MAG: hypothetical protein AB2A00_38145 [Myxococcota bacterium]
MKRHHLPTLALLALGSAGAQCPVMPGEDTFPPPQTGTSGAGVVRVDGTDRSYRVIPEESRLLLLVQKKSARACTFFHDHAVAARAVTYSFSLDRQAPGSSTLTARVAAAGLDPDEATSRDSFPETAGTRMSERDRQDVRTNMLEQLDAAHHPELTFTARNLTTLEGAGQAEVTADIKGRTSVVPLQGVARWEGERLILDGTASLEGTPHDIPSGTFQDCIEPGMGMLLHVVLAPGEESRGDEVDVVPDFHREFFPGQADCGAVGFSDVARTFLVRCGGCHAATPTHGATVPLVTWEDFHYDTRMSPGRPLYLDVAERILDPGPRRMPPPDATPLTSDEVARILAWVASGAERRVCVAPGGPAPGGALPTVRAAAPRPPDGGSSSGSSCSPLGYGDVQPILATHCVSCHARGGPEVALEDYEDGLLHVTHAAYQPLNRWQASLARMEDQSMPPSAAGDDDEEVPRPTAAEVARMRRWVELGTPREGCGDGGVVLPDERDAGSPAPGAPDASPPPTHPDAGSTPLPDAGGAPDATPPRDGGIPSDDAGRTEAGTTTPDAGAHDDAGPPPTPDAGPPLNTCTSGEYWTRGDHGSSQMHPGGDCMGCHAQRGDGPRFTAAGTVMGALHDETDCLGVPELQVRITDAEGHVLELTTNQSGNFRTSSGIAMPYTAEVVDARGAVRRMQTPQSDGNCMRCHTMEGAHGAPGRIIPPPP